MVDPLVPPDADVRGFKDMPMEVSRLLSSETWIMCTPEERSAAINLWFHSWSQVPAGSLPDNDRVLAHLSMSGERWSEVKEMALRGWVKADDGRLYHTVVCEKVNMMLEVRAQKSAAGRKGGSKRKALNKQKKTGAEAPAKQPLNDSKADDKREPSSLPFPSLPFPGGKYDADDPRASQQPDLNEIEAALREAAGESLDPTSTGLMVLSLPLAWAADGCDFELDVLPAIRAASARASPGTIRSWKYFSQAVADAKARRLAPMPKGKPDERPHTAKSRDASAREAHMLGIAQAVAEARG